MDDSCSPMNDAITIYTFWLVCFTAVLAVATIFLAAFTIDLALTSRKTAQRQLRAYVAARAENVSAFGPDVPVGIRFRMTNHGQTPAYDVSHTAAIPILPHPLPPDFQFLAPPVSIASRFVLHPRASFDAGVVAPRPFTDVEIVQATTNNGFRIYLYGTVTYRDAFNKHRETTFCLSVVPSQNLIAMSRGQPLPKPVNLDFQASEQHNEAT
jgi:hypothetical protein